MVIQDGEGFGIHSLTLCLISELINARLRMMISFENINLTQIGVLNLNLSQIHYYYKSG